MSVNFNNDLSNIKQGIDNQRQKTLSSDKGTNKGKGIKLSPYQINWHKQTQN